MKPLRLFMFPVLCLVLSLTFLSNITQAEDTLKTTAAQPAQGARIIQFANDQLTVKVKDMSLTELLQEIARQSGFTLFRYGSLDERITIEFHQIPLDEGLRRILRRQNFSVEYAQQTSEESQSIVRRPTKLWIFVKGKKAYPAQTILVEHSQARPSRQDVATDISRLQAALTTENPREREKAVAALGETGRPEAITPLSLALEDGDENVREAAIVALAEIGGNEAAQALAVALKDKDSLVREVAVIALGEIGGESAMLLLEQALADEDESVRETAAEMLAVRP